MWSLDEKVTKDDLKNDKKKDFNERQKSIAKIIGENLAAYVCVLIFLLLIGFIWTDFGINLSLMPFLSDSLVSILLFVLADICMAQIGARVGKLDSEYIKVHGEYISLRKTVIDAGITLMDAFCDWQIDVEYEGYVKKQCKALEIDYADYRDKYLGKNLSELKALLPVSKVAAVYALTQSKRIELTPDMLLSDGRVRSVRGGLGMSGEEYVEKHTIGPIHLFVTALFAILAAIPVFELTNDPSIGRIIYTVFKLAVMSYRMFIGYSRGARGYNSVELKYLQAKMRYLHLYLEYLKDKSVENTEK